ncbi:MAG: hypothetical protein U5R46_10160 [Gammaproteobacteria bacterium]|nr:hypothetical protein [Gammaproteobacteria bacterium]
MFRSIWQIIRGVYTQRRSGIDRANINHLRADLRFQLAMVEYAYFGRSGRRVARCLNELKSVLGDKAVHRYLRSLDPDLRTQFVERFQGARRSAGEEMTDGLMPGRPEGSRRPGAPESTRTFEIPPPASNVVPINHASRRPGDAEAAVEESGPQRGSRSADSSD